MSVGPHIGPSGLFNIWLHIQYMPSGFTEVVGSTPDPRAHDCPQTFPEHVRVILSG